MLKHELNSKKYYENKIEVTETRYELRKKELLQIRCYSDKLYLGEITEKDVPPNILEEVKSAVKIKNTPSLEEEQATEADYQNALAEMGVNLNG